LAAGAAVAAAGLARHIRLMLAGVLGVHERLEVARVDADAVMANVVEHLVICEWPHVFLIDASVGELVTPHRAAVVGADPAGPDPTRRVEHGPAGRVAAVPGMVAANVASRLAFDVAPLGACLGGDGRCLPAAAEA
jgi:hypothetical protein